MALSSKNVETNKGTATLEITDTIQRKRKSYKGENGHGGVILGGLSKQNSIDPRAQSIRK